MSIKTKLAACLAITVLLLSTNFSFGQRCATPGKDGGGPVSGVVNTYFSSVTSIASGSTSIIVGPGVGASTPITFGDLLLIIQVQGANVQGDNTNLYGDNSPSAPANGYLNSAELTAGLYEYAVASSNLPIGGGTLNLLSGTFNGYTHRDNTSGSSQGQSRYQVIRVPQYSSISLSANLVPLAWNGKAGGVIALDVAGVLNFNGFVINASGSGFRGGGGRQLLGAPGGTGTDYLNVASLNFHGNKGEGIAGTPRFIDSAGSLADNIQEGYPNGSTGRGAPGNAGGGGTDARPGNNDENVGGGGGSNGGTGGRGGNSWNTNSPVGGDPGGVFNEVSTIRIVMGGGGGSGTTNDGTGTPAAGLASSGAAGGGLVFIAAGSVAGAGTITADGANANNTVTNDGSGGGGAGGSVIIFIANLNSLANIAVSSKGGNGGTNTGGGASHGPGGGGGGGVVYANGTLNAATSVAGGANGLTATSPGPANYGSTAGSTGILVQNISAPITAIAAIACIPPPTASNVVAPVQNNAYGQTSIPSLLANDPYGVIAAYTILTVPAATQGVLYLCNPGCAPITAGQVVSPADIANLKFDPAPTFTGNAVFTYAATNATTIPSNIAIYTIPVKNEPPLADNLLTQVMINTAGAQVLPALAGADGDGTITTYNITSVPNASTEGSLVFCSNGTSPCTGSEIAITGPVSLTPAQAASISFTPVVTFVGNTGFNYTVTDNSGSTSPAASVTIPVKGTADIHVPPYADNIVAPQFTNIATANIIPAFSAHAPTGTIANYTVETIPSPSQGTLTFCSNGTEPCTGAVTAVIPGMSVTPAQMVTLKFTPNGTFSGTAFFTYSAKDNTGVKSNVANYTIPVVNIQPIANPVTTSPISNIFGQTAIPELSAHDPNSLTGYTITTIPAPASGILYLCNPGCNPVTAGQVIAPADIGKLTFDPLSSYAGLASFNYTVTDNSGTVSQPGVYTIPVTPAVYPPNVPPVAGSVSTAPMANSNGQTTLPALSATDADGTISSYTINSIPGPSQGVLYLCNPSCNPVTPGQVIVAADAANLKFDPAAGYSGNVIFDYTAKDNVGATSNMATFTIPVTAISPQANNVTANPLSATSGQTPIAALSATEIGGAIVSFTITNLPSAASGTLYLCTPGCVAVTAGQVIAAADAGSLQFTPSPTFKGIYTQFNYIATDAAGIISNVATFTIPLTTNAPLPVQLISFSAEKRTGDVKLTWLTENETGFKSFTVERSFNGTSFIEIGTVFSNNSTGISGYNYVDNIQNFTGGTIYYRLKMNDANGSFKYSPVAIIRLVSNLKKAVEVTPNPAIKNVQLRIGSDVNATAVVRINTVVGQALYQSSKTVYKGDNIISLDELSAKLSAGTYILQVVINGEILSAKFIYNK